MTLNEIAAIRKRHGAGAEIAHSLGCSRSLVSMVLAGERSGRHGKKTAALIQALKSKAAEITGGR